MNIKHIIKTKNKLFYLKLLMFSCLSSLILSTPLLAKTVTDQIKESDDLYQKRHLKHNLEKSISLLENTLNKPLTNDEKYTVYWKLAQRFVKLDDYTDIKKDILITRIENTENIIKNISTLNPKGVDGIYWYSVLIGKKGELRGVLNSLFLVPILQENMLKIISIDPNFPKAYFILSRLHRKAPGFISIGDINKSVTYINKALSLDPNESLFLVELAEVQIAKKQTREAKKTLNKILTLTPNPNYFQPAVELHKKQALKLLDKID